MQLEYSNKNKKLFEQLKNGNTHPKEVNLLLDKENPIPKPKKHDNKLIFLK